MRLIRAHGIPQWRPARLLANTIGAMRRIAAPELAVLRTPGFSGSSPPLKETDMAPNGGGGGALPR